MIDLTPLDVRKKRGDFRRTMRGYDPEEVDIFLEVAADRLEELVKENMALRERVAHLGARVDSQDGRERAVNEALVTAQQLREEIRAQAQKEADFLYREAEGRIERAVGAARAKMVEYKGALADLERQRARFLKGFRSALERELDSVEIEEQRTPLEDIALEIDLSGGKHSLRSLLKEDEGEGAAKSDSQSSADSSQVGRADARAVEGGMEARAGVDDQHAHAGKGGSEGASDAPAADSVAGADAGEGPDDDFVDIFGEKGRPRKEEP